MRTPAAAFRETISRWEGLLSVDPVDVGNYWRGVLVGSKYGVTAGALSAWRHYLGSPWPDEIKRADIEAITIEDAVNVGVVLYYEAPGWHRLPFSPAVESLVDFGWGAGARLAVKEMQKMIAVADDGVIGPITQAAFAQWLADTGKGLALIKIYNVRVNYYKLCVDRRPSNGKFLGGWINRARSFLSENAEWYAKWSTQE